ncbi:porin [Catenovulum sp. SM1970]|uniref:porin n=1 Tax=Marinifaba aquimaris TaxID=2741323 RepID=UPI0015733880|nr:porin [Marinifaba aquimaris]NTS77988.1 porin [Marinifaba aquimaris]
MKRVEFMKVKLSLITLLCAFPSWAAKEFGFLTEATYLQDDGEWQLNAELTRTEFQQENKSDWGLAAEYGLTDRLQIEVATQSQYQLEEGIFEQENSFEVSLGYNVYHQQQNQRSFSVELGYQDEEGEGGYELAALFSQALFEKHSLHLNVSYEQTDDEKEYALGLGYTVPLFEDIALMAEITRDKETEDGESGEDEYSSHYSLGMVYKIVDDLELGLAYVKASPKGDTEQ